MRSARFSRRQPPRRRCSPAPARSDKGLFVAYAPVVSSFVAEGYGDAFADGRTLAVANNAEEMIERCLSLLRNPLLATALAESGRRTIAQLFTRPVFRRAVLDAVIATASGRRSRTS